MLWIGGIAVAVTLLSVFFDRAARRRRRRLFGTTTKPARRHCAGYDGAPGPGDVGSIVTGGFDAGGVDF